MTELYGPFVGRADLPSTLPDNAAAERQLGRLLDALLLLEAEKRCEIADLARRVGLNTARLRKLLDLYMTAGASVMDDAPFTILFGAESGMADTEEDDDAVFDDADWVYVDDSRDGAVSLVEEVGRVALGIDQVVGGLLAIRHLLDLGAVPQQHIPAASVLEEKLSGALAIRVEADHWSAEAVLREAISTRRRALVTYRDPLTAPTSTSRFDLYDLHWHHDRLVVDGDDGAGLRRLEAVGIIDVATLDPAGAYEIPSLPAAGDRFPRVRAVVRVRRGTNAERWVRDWWKGEETGHDDDTVDLAIMVDDPAPERLGTLLLRLGRDASLVEPAELRDCTVGPARRLLAALG